MRSPQRSRSGIACLVSERLVIGVEPPSGTAIERRSVVTIIVSSGPAKVAVPDVQMLLADSARQALTSKGFEVLIDFADTEDPSEVNLVLDQIPPPNTQLATGAAVIIIVGLEST